MRQNLRRTAAQILALALLFGAAPVLHAQELRAEDEETGDPIEPVNRGIFWFNDKLDVFLFEPIAIGWEFVTPETVRIHLDQFFTNLRFPVRFVGSLLQAEALLAAEETGRFVVNSTVGVAGFFDPATGWGLEGRREDVGQAFGRWGMGPGFYLVLPLLGPSSGRDAVGRIFDSGLQSGPGLISPWAGAGVSGLDLINTRALLLDEIDQAKEASLDYYSLVRHAYLEQREALVRNGDVPAEEVTDDLYELDID